MLSSPTLAFYGKLPWMGDFISHNIDYNLQQRVDHWLSSGLSALQTHNPNWLDKYLSAPVWSFIIPAGDWCDTPLCGAVMPSVDRVGRYFPFIILFKLDEPTDEVLYCSQLALLADILPELLECEFLVNDICVFIDEHLNKTVDNFTSRQLSKSDSCHAYAALSFKKSRWYCPGFEMEIEHEAVPDANLFVSLFDHDVGSVNRELGFEHL